MPTLKEIVNKMTDMLKNNPEMGDEDFRIDLKSEVHYLVPIYSAIAEEQDGTEFPMMRVARPDEAAKIALSEAFQQMKDEMEIEEHPEKVN